LTKKFFKKLFTKYDLSLRLMAILALTCGDPTAQFLTEHQFFLKGTIMYYVLMDRIRQSETF